MRGCIIRRGKNSFGIILSLGRDALGRWKQKWHTFHGNRKGAERKLAELLAAGVDTNSPTPDLSLGDYLLEWLEQVAAMRASPRTISRYRDIVERILIPRLGEIEIHNLTTRDVQSAYFAWQRSAKNPRGVAAQTVQHYRRILNQALRHAARTGLINRNPVDNAIAPKVERFDPTVIDEATARGILDNLKDHRTYIPTVLATATGMRRGEILALKWADVDLQRGILTVNQTLEEVNHALRFKAPKSARGRRSVPLPAFVLPILEEHRSNQDQQRETFGSDYNDGGLVCCLPNGSPDSPKYFSVSFAAVLKARKLPRIRFHDLRHSHASWLLRLGVHAKVVSERLGHSTIGFTLDRYSHVMPGLQDEAARKLDGAFARALDSKVEIPAS